MSQVADHPGDETLPDASNVYQSIWSVEFFGYFVILIVFALAVRGAFLWQFRINLRQDPDAYREIAENILRCGVFGFTGKSGPSPSVVPTAYRPPLYPLLLASLRGLDAHRVSLAKVAVVHLFLGITTVAVTWFCAWKYCGMPQWRAVLAGLIVACDPILLHQQSLVMTETLATALAALALTCLAFWSARPGLGSAALAGLSIGWCSLCRPTFLPWLGLVAVAFAIAPPTAAAARAKIEAAPRPQWGCAPPVRRLAWACVAAVAGVAVMLPWGVRNAWVFGQPILTTTHGGYTLELGNNPQFYDWLSSSEVLPWDSRAWQAERQAAMSHIRVDEPSELFWDQWAYQRAWQAIRERPGDFFRAALYRIGQLWSPLPHRLTGEESAARSMGRWAVAGWYCGVYLLAMYGIARLGWKALSSPWLWGLLLVATWTGVHTLYWTNLRMRAPLIPFVALLAAEGAPTARLALRTWRWAWVVHPPDREPKQGKK